MFNKIRVFKLNSIKTKFRLSYILFAIMLCSTFILIFYIAETKIEKSLVESRLLQQLQLSLKEYGDQAVYHTHSGINIYKFQYAPENLKNLATDTVQEIEVISNGNNSELHFFKYNFNNQAYILTYLENATFSDTEYPVLAIFEDIEAIMYEALTGALLLSILVAFIFSYLSSKAIIKPILDLKNAVETDYQDLSQLSNLPTEVGVLARTIESKNRQLSGFLLREQLFTGDVSHELRTPLTIIMGASEVLESQLNEDSPLREFTTRINKTAKDTSQMISALLLLSRAPEQLDAPQTIINDIAQLEVERLSYLIKYKPVTCTIQADKIYSAYVRPELLQMAIGNLIKNAFQYTDKGDVVISIDDKKISIADTGMGIPEAKTHMMFERFNRLEHANYDSSIHESNNYESIKHKSTKQEGNNLEDNINEIPSTTPYSKANIEGTGLGLSIVQRIISHMGWRMTYQPNVNGGSTFIIFYQ